MRLAQAYPLFITNKYLLVGHESLDAFRFLVGHESLDALRLIRVRHGYHVYRTRYMVGHRYDIFISRMQPLGYLWPTFRIRSPLLFVR